MKGSGMEIGRAGSGSLGQVLRTGTVMRACTHLEERVHPPDILLHRFRVKLLPRVGLQPGAAKSPEQPWAPHHSWPRRGLCSAVPGSAKPDDGGTAALLGGGAGRQLAAGQLRERIGRRLAGAAWPAGSCLVGADGDCQHLHRGPALGEQVRQVNRPDAARRAQLQQQGAQGAAAGRRRSARWPAQREERGPG